METEKELVQIDMPCVCNEEDKKEADKVQNSIIEKLECEPRNFVSAMIASLWWDHSCVVDGIYMDMWFGVSASTDNERFFVPCDRVEDGLGAIWEYFDGKEKK